MQGEKPKRRLNFSLNGDWAVAVAAILGSVITGVFAWSAVSAQIQAEAARERTLKAGEVYSQFLVAADQYGNVSDLPNTLPARINADHAVDVAFMNVYLYGSQNVITAAEQVEKAMDKGSPNRVDAETYSGARLNFIHVFKTDIGPRD